jgi:hypothetical protein
VLIIGFGICTRLLLNVSEEKEGVCMASIEINDPVNRMVLVVPGTVIVEVLVIVVKEVM